MKIGVLPVMQGRREEPTAEPYAQKQNSARARAVTAAPSQRTLYPESFFCPALPDAAQNQSTKNKDEKRMKQCKNVEMSVGVYKGQETRGVSDGTPSGRAATRDRTAAVGEMKEGWVQRRMTR